MSTSAISSSSLDQQQYFQTRRSDLNQLGQALKSGDLAAAQTAFNSIVSLGQSGPFKNGDPFAINQREQDFTAIGHALQSGDLAGAQQAFGALKETFTHPNPPPVTNDPTSGSGSGPEIVLNLSNSSGSNSPEQVTINIANSANGGGEQVSLSVGNQGSNPQKVTFNLSPNSNEQIVINLLDGSSSTGGSSSSAASSGGLSVSA
jgi:hypothetical protein